MAHLRYLVLRTRKENSSASGWHHSTSIEGAEKNERSRLAAGATMNQPGSVDILATSLKFERTIDRQRGFLWRQEVRWPKSDSCLLPASLCKSPGRCSRATEAVSANVNLPSRSCWPFSA